MATKSDMARTTNSRKAHGPAPTHPGMSSRTNTTLGAPTRGAPPDASSPTDHFKQHGSKTFAVPAIAHGHKSDPQRGHFDAGLAEAMFSEAAFSGSTKLPATVRED